MPQMQVGDEHGPRGTRLCVLLNLLTQIASKPCFHALRTQKRLGYVVSLGAHKLRGILMLQVRKTDACMHGTHGGPQPACVPLPSPCKPFPAHCTLHTAQTLAIGPSLCNLYSLRVWCLTHYLLLCHCTDSCSVTRQIPWLYP